MGVLLVITVLSLAVAAVMSAVAWRLTREERQRSEARIETLAAEIKGDALPPFAHAEEFFARRGPARTPGSLLAALAIGVLLVCSGGALAILLTHGSRTSPAAPSVASPVLTTAASGPAVAPIELTALGHERLGTRLLVRGVVRNPDRGRTTGPLTAVVTVFNHEGGLAASGRAPLERARLAPGVESTFVVTVTGVDDVDRYRVSFRTGDLIVAHIDRRDRTDNTTRAELP